MLSLYNNLTYEFLNSISLPISKHNMCGNVYTFTKSTSDNLNTTKHR